MQEQPNQLDVQLLENPLSIAHCQAFVEGADCGGIVHFIGTVRDNTDNRTVTRLEFEAYDRMAIQEMQKIGLQMLERWPIRRVSIHHRKGVLAIGDIAVIIAVGAPHRGAAFEACQYGIDTLKQTVPIWKKEVFTDGSVWVAAHP